MSTYSCKRTSGLTAWSSVKMSLVAEVGDAHRGRVHHHAAHLGCFGSGRSSVSRNEAVRGLRSTVISFNGRWLVIGVIVAEPVPQ